MGWGLFIARRALRRPKGNAEADWKWVLTLYLFLGIKFMRSYKKRVIAQTVLVHPTIIAKTDDSEWQIDLQKRAARDWGTVQIAVILYFLLSIILEAWLPALLFTPLVWYYCKYRAVKMSAKEINQQFMDAGYNIKELFEQMPGIYEEHKKEKQEYQKQEIERLIKSQEAAYKRKFGIE